ncbi:MAG TPA: R3H domain-containing nucleic acid-binding protein [Pelolinea sp.]|nr:R3H domain-containing nucleic acid-binding protein [Pelolinea sp.]
MTQRRITDDLPALFAVLPDKYINAVSANNNVDDLLEIIMDLGRLPMARFVDREFEISDQEVMREEIDEVVSRIGEFDADNRAGIERTLHRISAIRNKHGAVVGLTSRVGRAVYGTIDIIEDLVVSGKGILLLGRPGIGKTTMLREAARILAEKTRVVIVDTSNEIGGDGDVPHPAVGRARRMQVAQPSMQHEVMIEAVENHNPEVIVIDEIGRELEAVAARTIAERGVQLVATAHGRTLENLLLNPTLSDLVGGIESVTLSDEEARRRGTQKTVLERRAPPTFDVLIEIQERDRLAVHEDVAEAVDNLLRGFALQPEIRYRDENDEIHIQKPERRSIVSRGGAQGLRRSFPNGLEDGKAASRNFSADDEGLPRAEEQPQKHLSLKPVSIYAYGVARNRLEQSTKKLGVPVKLSRDLNQADVMITLKSYYRKRQRPILNAEERGVPIYVLRSNSASQIDQALVELFNLSETSGHHTDLNEVSDQANTAIEAVRNGQRWVDLPPASARVRRIQHELARDADLVSHSYGKDPNRHVRIFRE